MASYLDYPQGMLAGQTAIITGSGQGIGAETARLFANEGAKVVVCDIDATKAKAIAQGINDASAGRAISVPGDITDPKYPSMLVAKAAEFGGGRIHLLVNNAGYTWDNALHEITDKQVDTMLSVHNVAPFRLIRAAAPYFMVKDGEKRAIVNVSSTSGMHGKVLQANYAMAKSGLVGLTKSIAKEWGPEYGVRANTVAFGYIETRLSQLTDSTAFITTMDGEKVPLGVQQKALADLKKGTMDDIPLGRPGTTTEAASSILAVVSPLFAYVSGQTIEVTGGRQI
ncbi:hypothetical protein FE257_004889 [Aspergillus nanangensis]|uniref:Uncharacterized protein n=1 Tax=Aspergillus nanangensis TaxID=2582783 RepID=A0AAD4CAX0_ASPNN|nr:hypothetical protein FE257_004889 [Aspergillus nanangensis]